MCVCVCVFSGRRTLPRSFMPQENLFQLVPSSRTRSYNGDSTLQYSDLRSLGRTADKSCQRGTAKCKWSDREDLTMSGCFWAFVGDTCVASAWFLWDIDEMKSVQSLLLHIENSERPGCTPRYVLHQSYKSDHIYMCVYARFIQS